MGKIGITVGVDGEKVFTKSLREMDAGLKLLNSEMRAVSGQFLTNAKSIDAYNAKNKVLEKQVAAQKEKVEKLREILEKTSKTYDESDKRTAAWATRLNIAEATLFKTQNTLNANKDALADYAKFADKTVDSVGKLDGEMMSLKNSLDDVDKKYQKNKNSAQYFGEKQKILSELFQKHSEKIEILRAALEKSGNAFGKDSEQTKKFEKALAGAEKELSNTKIQLKNVEIAANSAGKSTKTFGDILKANLSAQAISAGFSKIIGAVKNVGKYIQNSAKNAANFGYEISKMAKKTGLSTEQIQKLRAVAKNTGVDLEIVAKSYLKLIQAMNSTPISSEKNFSKKLSTSKNSEKIGISMDDEGHEKLNKMGEIFKKLSVDARDASGSLRDGLTVYFEIIDALKNMENSTERSATAMQIFGKQAAELNPILQIGSDGYREITENLTLFSDETIKSMAKLEKDYGKLSSTFGAIKLSLGAAFTPIFQAVADDAVKVTGKIKEVFSAIANGEDQEKINQKMDELNDAIVGFIGKLDENMPQFFEVGGRIIKAIFSGMQKSLKGKWPEVIGWGTLLGGAIVLWKGATTAAIGAVSASISSGIASLGTLIGEGMVSLGPAMAAAFANPITWIIAAIAAATTGLTILAVKFWPEISNFTRSLWKKIKLYFDEHWQDFLLWIYSWPSALAKTLYDCDFVEKIGDFISKFWGQIEVNLESVWLGIKNWFSSLSQKISSLTAKSWNIFLDFLPKIPEKISYYLEVSLSAVTKFFANLSNLCGQFAKDAWSFVTSEIPRITEGIIDWFAKLPEKIGQWLAESLKKIANFGGKAFEKSTEIGQNFVENILIFFREMPEKIGKWLNISLDRVKNWFTEMLQSARNLGFQMSENIMRAFSELPGRLGKIGQNLIYGLWNGISSMASWLRSKIRQFCDGFVRGFEKAFGINSPSKIFEERVGKYLALGIGKGF